ncbi:MAG: hypothetical protein QXR91_08355 [Nitrososphaerales archaeon]
MSEEELLKMVAEHIKKKLKLKKDNVETQTLFMIKAPKSSLRVLYEIKLGK